MSDIYIIIAGALQGLGGGELYNLRRAKYLTKLGYEVIFITNFIDKNQIKLKELKEYKILAFPEIEFNKNGIEKLIKKDIPLEKNKKIYIEANYFWSFGEKLAKELQCKSLIYIMAEQDFFNWKDKDFYLKKLKKEEVIGVTEETLRICFGKYWDKEKYKNEYVNVGFYKEEIVSNTVKEKEFKLEKKKNCVRITTVSRFEKTYIEDMIKSVYRIAEEYKDIKIELVLIGDSKDGKKKLELMKKYQSKKNIEIKFLGYIEPLFSEIYINTDLFIGMGTALVNAASYGCICLAIDPRDNKSSGFFSRDVNTVGYRKDDKTFSIDIKLKEFLLMSDEEKKCLKRNTMKLFEEEFEFESVMSKLDKIIFNLKKDNEYIDVSMTLKMRLKYIFYKLGLLSILKKIKINRKKFVNL